MYDSVLAFRDRLQMILTREKSGLDCKREHEHTPVDRKRLHK